jgi:hypothetical protein
MPRHLPAIGMNDCHQFVDALNTKPLHRRCMADTATLQLVQHFCERHCVGFLIHLDWTRRARPGRSSGIASECCPAFGVRGGLTRRTPSGGMA